MFFNKLHVKELNLLRLSAFPTKITKAYHDMEKYGLYLDTFDCSLGFTQITLLKDTQVTSELSLHSGYTPYGLNQETNWCDDGEEHGEGHRHWQLSDVQMTENPDFSDKSLGLCHYHYARPGFGGAGQRVSPCCLVTEDKHWLTLV